MPRLGAGALVPGVPFDSSETPLTYHPAWIHLLKYNLDLSFCQAKLGVYNSLIGRKIPLPDRWIFTQLPIDSFCVLPVKLTHVRFSSNLGI